ncbi:hypothetical protein [Glycomyces sp. MUSA5-2]|uniref:hypothetical protein n=1 Tax=Glycomyces sp. MUSA5-2 TaxID=2053002 RepID=UPI003008177E
MTAADERAKIIAAMSRLLDGIPLRSDGALTVVSLAVEAEVKRHVLTHRHTDLKDEFYARVRAQGHVPDSERRLRERLDQAEAQLAELREENTDLRATNEGYARVVNLLTLENAELAKGDGARVVPLRRP